MGRADFGAASSTRMAAVCVLLALAPFAVWTARNWSVFHVFEPLAPRLATDPGESANPGWERWVKSWCLDFVSTYEIYWNVPGGQAGRERAAEPGVRLAGAVRGDGGAGRGLQQQRDGADAGDRCAALGGWPRSGSRRIRCATTCGCRWAAWPICGCARAWRTCPSTWIGGSTRTITRRRSSAGATRG